MPWSGTGMNKTNAPTGRNEPCPCGSGKKYKHCCGQVARPATPVGISSAEIGAIVSLINSGRFPEAEARSRALVTRLPTAGIAWKVLSVALLRQGRDALEACTRAAALLPDDAEAQHNLGAELVERRQWLAAVPVLRKAVSSDPNNADLLVELADALREAGDVTGAVGVYQRALVVSNDNAIAWNNLANALVELRRPTEALDHYGRALRLRPKDPLILCNISNALRHAQRPADALATAEQALAVDRGSTSARNFIGQALLALGRRAEAIGIFREALAINPKDAVVMVGLAQALRETGELAAAHALCRQAVEIDPAYPDGHCTLANVLFDQRLMEEAGRSYQHAIALQPRHVAALTGLGLVLRQQRLRLEAESACQQALALDPKCVEALSLLGELRADDGRFDEAQALFQKAIECNPNFAFGYSNIAAHRRMTGDEGAWRRGVEALLVTPLPVDQRVSLHFALGKFLDDTKQYALAFEQFRQGNELARSVGEPYDPRRLTARIDQLIGTCDETLLRSCQSIASGSDVPVFIVGMPRSGTSLVEQILASHGSVAGAGEIAFWDAAFDAGYRGGPSAGFDTDRLAGVAAAYLERLRSGIEADVTHIVDKMPANFMYLGLIHAIFPRARIIHMRRHPIDTCLSIYFQNFFSLGHYQNDLDSLVHYYGEYARTMQHWRRLLPDGVMLDVPYEELTANQELWTRRIIDFLGLPWDANCLDFHATNRSVLTASRWQVRQRMNPAAAGRWVHYRDQLGPLRQLLSLA